MKTAVVLLVVLLVLLTGIPLGMMQASGCPQCHVSEGAMGLAACAAILVAFLLLVARLTRGPRRMFRPGPTGRIEPVGAQAPDHGTARMTAVGMRWLHRVLFLAVVVLAVLVRPADAFAHAYLVSTTPQAGSRLGTTPG